MQQPVKTVHEMLLRLENTPNKNPKLLGYLENDEWKYLSTDQVLEMVNRASYSLAAMGLKKGEKLGILAPPSPQWTILDLAISSIGLVSVPIFPNISEENFLFEVKQTEIKTIFFGTSLAWDLVQKNRQLFDKVIDMENPVPPQGAISFDEFLKIGDDLRKEQPDLVLRLRNSLKPLDVATIVYTSGSTGVPKGAVLTQQGIVATIDVKGFEWNEKEVDIYLSILPLAHIFGRNLNFASVGNNATTCYLQDPKAIAQACQVLHPTFFAVVPRILEKIYAKILSKIQNSHGLKKAIGQWAFDLANEENHNGFYKNIMHAIADKAVYKAFREAVGGRARIMISGGAPLNPHLYHFFEEIGFPILQGWGLTEGCPVTINLPLAKKTNTCGRPIIGNQIKISSENNEILVKGPVRMIEYFKNPEATARVIDKDGWLHTGDAGEIDDDGFLTIVGRIKEMFKTSTGEYIVPVPIEQSIAKIPLIDVALVVAEGRKYATVLLFPDFEVLAKLKADHNMSQVSDEEFLQSDFVRNQIKQLLDSVNENLNRWEKVLDYRFVLHHLTIESGELTPSMKVKRDVLEKKFAPIIETMYVADVAPVV